MKKLLLLVASLVLVFGLAACGPEKETYEIAMITDSGTIDDESFNQGTWEGIEEFCMENDLTYKYYKPLEVSDDSYLDAIELAIDGGAKVVVTPGFLFESSIYEAQTLYPDVYFILIDGVPHTPDYSTFETADNTLSILFAEHESGFLAGYAAVMDGYRNLGFTGGMAVPAVVKFGIGYVAGAYYAADELGVDITFGDATYHYFGDFGPSDDHKNLASSWYVAGTEIIFSAAGGAGASVMAAAADNEAKMIGVDIDQSGQSTTVVTSAMKQLGVAVQQGLQLYLDDAWEGGKSVVKDATNDGVALPMDTSVFTAFTQADYDAIYADLVDGTVVVPIDTDALATFLAALTNTDVTGAPTADVINDAS
jgi:basic membrane protein A